MVSTMEGDGEGMVAIIEGLQDSAIAITVMNNRRYNRQRPRPYGTRKPFAPKTKASVETSTESFNRVNKGAQICDGRYASSYQLAHCHKVPTSPTVVVPEFPPQRAEPCRTQGNFELRGYGHEESYRRSHRSVSPLHSLRNGKILAGSPIYASRSTWMDSFAHSLRRYPCLSPELNMSTEFIQKLITFTQTKHHSKSSRRSQSMRSLLHERKQETISNRHIQMRTDHETPTKDDNNYNDSGQINESLKSNNVTSDFKNDKRNTRYIDNVLDETYDYLKSNIPCRHPKTCEVRTMTKHVKETLKQIYNSKPMTTLRICPKIKRRYEEHLKEHHSCGTGTLKPCTVSKANQNIEEHDASTQRRCSMPKNQSTLRKTCFCNKPKPCDCEQRTSKLQNGSKTAFEANKGNKIEGGIHEWLHEIPVSANESNEEKATRNAKIKQLTDTLKGFNDDELNERGIEEIRKCIDSLPMWFPGDKCEQNKFKEQLADKLLLKLNLSPKKDKECCHSRACVDKPKLGAELLDTLEHLLTKVEGDRKQELSQMARSLVDTLMNESRNRKNIENWPCPNKNKSGNKNHEEDDLLDFNGDKLKSNRKRWDHHNNLPNAIAREISSIIDQEHAELSANKKQNLKDRIANVLGNNISNNKSRSSREDSKSLIKSRNSIDIESEAFQYIVEKEILDLLAEITGEDSVDLRNKRKVAFCELFCRIGDIIYDSNLSEDNKINEAMQYLRNISFPLGVSKEQFTSELINRIRSLTSERKKEKRRISFNPEAESTRISTEENQDLDLEKEILDEFSDIINNWIDDLLIDLNATEDKMFKETMIKDLANDFMDRLKYLQLNPGLKTTDQEELEHFKYQIFRWLNKLVPANDLYPILPKTQALMDRLKQVDIPHLVQHSGISMESNALENEISTWLKEIPPCLLKLPDSYNHKQMVKRLADIIQQQRNNRNMDLNREIEQCLNEVVKDKQKLNHIVQCLKNRLSYKGFIDDTGWSTLDNTSQFIGESFEGDITDWFKDLPLYQQRNPKEKRMQEQLINVLANDLKRIAENAQPGENTDELFMNEILRQLKQFPMNPEQKYDDQFHKNTATQLLHYIKGLKTFQEISHSQSRLTDEYFTAVIKDWLNSIPVNPRSSITEANLFAAIQEEFITRFKELHQQHSTADNDQMLRKEIKEYLLLLPMDPSKKHDQKFLNDKVEELLRNLQEVSREHVSEREPKKGILKDQIFDIIKDLSRKSLTNTDSKPGYKKPTDILYDNIEDWCNNLPIYLGDSPADIEKVQTIKQNIASKLIKKVGELNMNPEIFNDDLLYEDVLQDEIEIIVSSIPTNPELERSLPKLIRNLTKNVKEANHKARDELTGQVYKQQLKDSISKTLPLPSNISSEEQVSFELLKDCVADAFINLHYVGNDEALKNKYEKKIKDEVKKFCKDFMKRHPNIPMNSTQLNQDLYKALCNVTLPNEASMKSEVGQARIKDTIDEWTKDLPLIEQTQAEQLQQSKMVSILAKRLNDLEKEESFNPEINNDERIQKEIVKWIKKLPLKPVSDDKIENYAAKLVNDIRNTENSRRFSGLQMRSDFMDSSYKNNNNDCEDCSIIPPCTLSNEDSAYLQRIRVRRPSISICKPQRNCMDVAVSPCPVDSYTQTRTRPWCDIICNDKNESQSCKTDQQTQKSKASDSCVQSKKFEVSPKVIIREYHWDSTEDSKICPNQNQCVRDYVQPVCKHNVGENYVRPNPCTSFQPCLSPRSSIQNTGPRISHEKLPLTSTPKRPGMRRKRNSFPQPCFSFEPSANSTAIEEECTRNRRNKPRTLIDSVHFTEEDDLLDGSCRSRISPVTSDEELESMGREHENNHENVRSGCRHSNTKCACRKSQTCPRMGGNEVKNCSHRCPHPSFLYFRK